MFVIKMLHYARLQPNYCLLTFNKEANMHRYCKRRGELIRFMMINIKLGQEIAFKKR